MVHFGFHVSSGGKIELMPEVVNKLGGECFQFFSRNPYGGKVAEILPEKINQFLGNCKKYSIKNYYIHAPYFINFASLNNRIFYGSIGAIKEDLERAKKLKVKYVVTHIGSGRDFIQNQGLFETKINLENDTIYSKYHLALEKTCNAKNFSKSAYNRVIEGLKKVTDNYVLSDSSGEMPLLIEIAAGSGAIIGSSIDEVAFFLEKVPSIAGFCFDTAHAFASGYDLRNEDAVYNLFSEIESKIGKEKFKLIHLNDSKGALNSRIDRHSHLGKGEIGLLAFKYIIDYLEKKNYNIDVILETPTKDGLVGDLKMLKEFRSQVLKREKK